MSVGAGSGVVANGCRRAIKAIKEATGRGRREDRSRKHNTILEPSDISETRIFEPFLRNVSLLPTFLIHRPKT